MASSVVTRPSTRRVTAPSPGSPTTASRAVRPGVVVPNRRLPTMAFGEGTLAWRCLDCGAVGSLAAFPATCPDCGARRESLYYELED